MIYTYFDNPLGEMLALSDGEVLTGLYFGVEKHLPELDSNWKQQNKNALFQLTQKQLSEYAKGKRKEFTVPFCFTNGTPFQRKVWQALLTVPYGKTLSYLEIAKHIRKPKSVRAVANAIGSNPISLIVPCHRIIGSDGSLTGYAGGLDRKRAILALEQN